MKIEIVTIGDELLLGQTIDTNAAVLARTLGDVGVEVVRRATVGDDAAGIATAVREALDRTGAVITTGGLGPTADDMTKAAIAALFGRELVLDEAHVAWMRERWRTRFGREMPESNVAQAMLPAGARKLENRHGSAPGVFLEDERGRFIIMLPGVPRELRGMAADTVAPLLAERGAREGGARVVRSLTLRTTGIAESALADLLGPIAREVAGLQLAYLPSPAGVDLRVTARDLPSAEADAALDRARGMLREQVGAAVYGENDADLASIVLDLLRKRGWTIAVAESCTGGLLGARLTAIPGSSDVVQGGVIAYADRIKVERLGVDPAVLARDGAVSEAVAKQMAAGARALGADVGVGITGIAGPSGGTPEKPVGTVWIAVETPEGSRTHGGHFIGDRDEIRQRSAQTALNLVRMLLVGDAARS